MTADNEQPHTAVSSETGTPETGTPVTGPPEAGPTQVAEPAFPDRRPWQRRVFAVLLAFTIAVLLARSPIFLVVLGWFLAPYEDASGAGVLSHRVHEIAFGILFGWALLGAGSQWRSPKQNVGGMLQLLLTLGILAFVVSVTTGRFELLSLLMLLPPIGLSIFHPAGWRLFFPRIEPSLGLLALALMATPWLLLEAGEELGLANTRALGHTTHWAAMASFLILLAALGILAALRPPGYALVAASVGAGAGLFGIAGMLYPFDASSNGAGAFFIVWGAAWIAVAARAGTAQQHQKKRGRIRTFLAVAGTALAFLVGLAALGLVASSPPNVPHNLNRVPEAGFVAWKDATRQTCLACHARGKQGAIVVDHTARTCGGEFDNCIERRADCLGCHGFDPALRVTVEAHALPDSAHHLLRSEPIPWRIADTP